MNLWNYVWINDYLYFLGLLGSFFQHFSARIISWVSFRENMAISEALEGGVRTGKGLF